jgi:hypothetical protein
VKNKGELSRGEEPDIFVSKYLIQQESDRTLYSWILSLELTTPRQLDGNNEPMDFRRAAQACERGDNWDIHSGSRDGAASEPFFHNGLRHVRITQPILLYTPPRVSTSKPTVRNAEIGRATIGSCCHRLQKQGFQIPWAFGITMPLSVYGGTYHRSKNDVAGQTPSEDA